jgi:hypothetical protein
MRWGSSGDLVAPEGIFLGGEDEEEGVYIV